MSRPNDDIADYIASNVSTLTRWSVDDQTGNVFTDAMNPRIGTLQVAVLLAPGAETPNVETVRSQTILINVYSDEADAYANAETIYELFQRIRGFNMTNFNFKNIRAEQPERTIQVSPGYVLYQMELFTQYEKV